MQIAEMLGKIFTKVEQVGDDELHFYCEDGKHYKFYHDQDCCESVTIDDINGNLEDLIGSPITLAEESSNSDEKPRIDWEDSFTWTFYRFATVKGYVDVKWYGSSNGYYSESVDFKEVEV